MKSQNKPEEIPMPHPEIKPLKVAPVPEINPEHPVKIIPEEKPKHDNPAPPVVEPPLPEIKPGKDPEPPKKIPHEDPKPGAPPSPEIKPLPPGIQRPEKTVVSAE